MTVVGFTTTDFAQCNFPVSNYTYNIGQLPQGNYRFEIFRRADFDPTRVDLVGTTNFTVAGIAPSLVIQVPTISTFGIASLCGLLLMAVFGTRKS